MSIEAILQLFLQLGTLARHIIPNAEQKIYSRTLVSPMNVEKYGFLNTM